LIIVAVFGRTSLHDDIILKSLREGEREAKLLFKEADSQTTCG
jgi:hypothetical protein